MERRPLHRTPHNLRQEEEKRWNSNKTKEINACKRDLSLEKKSWMRCALKEESVRITRRSIHRLHLMISWLVHLVSHSDPSFHEGWKSNSFFHSKGLMAEKNLKPKGRHKTNACPPFVHHCEWKKGWDHKPKKKEGLVARLHMQS